MDWTGSTVGTIGDATSSSSLSTKVISSGAARPIDDKSAASDIGSNGATEVWSSMSGNGSIVPSRSVVMVDSIVVVSSPTSKRVSGFLLLASSVSTLFTSLMSALGEVKTCHDNHVHKNGFPFLETYILETLVVSTSRQEVEHSMPLPPMVFQSLWR